jgi:hypothetical protein
MLQQDTKGGPEVRHPPYHLRPNKAIDRFLLVEILSLLARSEDLAKYRYYGLGGPFLEDFRLLGQHFPGLSLVSLESHEHTFLRQRFHRSAKNVDLRRETVQSFLSTYSGEEKCVFWLDYTDFSPDRLAEFQAFVDRVAEGSVVKVTVKASLDDELPDRTMRALPQDEREKASGLYFDNFKSKYDAMLPSDVEYAQLRAGNFPSLLQKMFRIAAQRALPAGSGRTFQIIHSCYYADQTQMFSLTGIVCREEEARRYRDMFGTWELRNLRWRDPERIDMPVLSIKERMLLERYLPARKASGKSLRRALGYNIDDGLPQTLRKLAHYATFYRYYPYFAKVSVV